MGIGNFLRWLFLTPYCQMTLLQGLVLPIFVVSLYAGWKTGEWFFERMRK